MPDHVIALPSQLGPVLQALRRSRGLSQKDLAERLGVTRQAVSDLERAPERATFERLMRVLGALDAQFVLRPRKPASSTTW